jgi:glycosidase
MTHEDFSPSPAQPRDNLKLAFTLLTTMRGMPELYSGDEVAMEGGDDPDNRRDFPGGFGGSSHDAFTPSGRTTKEQDIFNWASSLIHLRESHKAISAGQQQDLFADATAIAYLRGNDLANGCKESTGTERILVVISKASAPRNIDLETTNTGLADCAHFNPLFPAIVAPVRSQRGTISIPVNANGVAIYSVR